MRQDLKDSLENDLNQGVLILNKAVQSVTRSSINLIVNRNDKFKILNFISWSERYYISLEEMLALLLGIWQKKFKSNTKGLGVKISLLCGPKSKEIVKNYIKKTYPNKENIKLYKQANQDKLLSKQTFEFSDPLEYISEYKKSIIELRKKDKKQSEQMKRRRYRDNPFI